MRTATMTIPTIPTSTTSPTSMTSMTTTTTTSLTTTSTPRALALAPPLVLAACLGLLGGCPGRDAGIAALNEGVDGGPTPVDPVAEGRTLGRRALFGSLPVDNRFEDPLMTLSGTGWFAMANDFRSYPTVFRRVAPSPTQTPWLEVPGEENRERGGASVYGQLKADPVPLHVEVWLGRPGNDARLGAVRVLLTGLFVGSGEAGVDLAPDDSDEGRVLLDDTTWFRFRADLEEGPVGWAGLFIGDESEEPRTLFVGGAAAVDLEPLPGAALRSAPKRALSDDERRLIDAVRDKTRTLAPPRAPRPAPLPGLPPARSPR